MKPIATLLIMSLFSFLFGKTSPVHAQEIKHSFYDFKMKGIDGTEVDFAQYKGKNILIVNTASKCGYTHQYKELEELHEKYGHQVTVLGFPANNFLGQEPGSNEEIATFCKKNYGVKFQLFEKISVKGKNTADLYRWLAAKSGKTPSWNFCKYLLNKEGQVISFFSSKVNPLDSQIIDKIQ